MLNIERLERLFQHILASAALSEDFKGRQLGPIHFLKYAYLADLAYAERHEGETYTGLDWRFYHFGPWSETAYHELPLALERANAIRSTFPSKYESDLVRYGLDRDGAERLIQGTEHYLPFIVSNAVGQAVHEHGSDTADLLRRVYLTRPMLSARPGEMLTFVTSPRATPADNVDEQAARRLSKSEKKARNLLIENARKEIARRLARPTERITPKPPPRYDAVFAEGTAFLDRLAGEPPEPGRGEVTFDDSVWQSDQRRDPDVP